MFIFRKNILIKNRNKIKTLFTLFVLGFLLIATTLVQAQTYPDPIENTDTVSATMPDIVDPSTPILISPENGDLLSTNTPQFIWQECTDNVAVSHYQLYLDGELAINNISSTGSFTLYDLSYSAITGYYTLDLNYTLSQGSHTWKIVAADTSDNTADSATWTFEIDSVAPTFVISSIGSETVSISAQDSSSVPSTTITLSDNEPTIVATGEAGATVNLEIVIPDEDNLSSSEDIDINGDWSHQLPILTRDVTIILNFIITDEALHVSAIEGVPILIEGQVIIPYTPPKELVHQLTPPSVRKIIRIPLVKLLLNFFGPWLAAIILLAAPVIATLLLAKDFAAKLSWEILITIWKILGLIPTRERQGYAVNTTDFEGVPFAKLTFVSQHRPNLNQLKLNPHSPIVKSSLPPLVQTVLTDKDGLYLPVELPPRTYRLSTSQKHHRFPTKLSRPNYLEKAKFYLGEDFELTKYKPEMGFMIPMDRDLGGKHSSNFKKTTKAKSFLAKVTAYSTPWNWALLFGSGLVALFYPSIANLGVIAWYIGLWAIHASKKSRSNIEGLVVDANGQPIVNSLIEISELSGSKQVRAILSDDRGRFFYNLKQGQYQFDVFKIGYQETEQAQNEENKKIEITSLFDRKKIVLMMVKVS
ncbi:MAG: carboxypeptidase regulatory-like domain-containing protein [Patescibacteria group bacterium]|nr:carboxypeptidase regulatory-like domain-containing protein [Patescibacteria group bacterium]